VEASLILPEHEQRKPGVRVFNNYALIGYEVPNRRILSGEGQMPTSLQPTEVVYFERSKYKPHIGKKQIAKELKRRKQPIAKE
jgi:hypothetical protein